MIFKKPLIFICLAMGGGGFIPLPANGVLKEMARATYEELCRLSLKERNPSLSSVVKELHSPPRFFRGIREVRRSAVGSTIIPSLSEGWYYGANYANGIIEADFARPLSPGEVRYRSYYVPAPVGKLDSEGRPTRALYIFGLEIDLFVDSHGQARGTPPDRHVEQSVKQDEFRHYLMWHTKSKVSYDFDEKTIEAVFNALYKAVYGHGLPWLLKRRAFSGTVAFIKESGSVRRPRPLLDDGKRKKRVNRWEPRWFNISSTENDLSDIFNLPELRFPGGDSDWRTFSPELNFPTSTLTREEITQRAEIFELLPKLNLLSTYTWHTFLPELVAKVIQDPDWINIAASQEKDSPDISPKLPPVMRQAILNTLPAKND